MNIAYIAERIDDRIEERFAFQWCDAQGTPWWSMADVNVDNQTGGELTPSLAESGSGLIMG